MNGFCFGLLILSSVLLLVATWRIFRPREAWAQGACIGGSAIVCLVFGLRVASGELAVAEIHTPGMALFFTCRLAIFGWITFEALRYHGMLKRRLEIGLADPLVTQQIFLWGLSGLATLGATATITATIFVLGRHPVEFQPAMLAITVLAVTSAGTMWCAFFPPRALRRRVEAHAG